MAHKLSRQHPAPRGPPILGGILAGMVFITVIVAVLIYFDAQKQVLGLLQWIDAQGGWALLLFALVMAGVVVLLLPGVMFTTGAGFVFGIVQGTACVVIGTTLGAILAFLIARHLFGAKVANYMLTHERLKLLSDEIRPSGWKLVLLTRLIPFFPFKLSNYFFGLTPVSLRGFAAGTLFGIVPYSLHSVYLGSIAADISTIGLHPAERTPLEWGLYIGGFVATLIAVIYLARRARHALAQTSTEPSEKDRETEHEGGRQCRG